MTEFITRNYGNKEYEVIIKTDSKEHYEATEDFARRLIDHAKPKTNADRIRAMSDEELAKAIGYRCLCTYIQDETHFCETREECGSCILEWLKQPAEGE